MSAAEARLKIGEVAKLAGTTPRTIRYYEEIGLLPAADGREPGAHRTYAQSDVDRLIEVMRLRALLGVTLDGLKELVEAEDNRAALKREWHEGVEDPVRRREILESLDHHAERQLELVRARRDEIAKLEAELLARRKRIRDRRRELDDEPASLLGPTTPLSSQ
ncbi:MAG TPA: MerR family transcriptional regulator [Solirubrobacterales bacterium]|nr:MerR family transcriptional regulator [Solirubrobacterales bacterium]